MNSMFLKVGLWNAGSLATNQYSFINAIDRHQVDLMAINETWLRRGEEGRAPFVPQYRLVHTPRPTEIKDGRGGGIGFYIKRGIKFRTCIHPVHPSVEQMWLRTKISGNDVIFGTAYRPPWFDAQIFLNAIIDSIASFSDYRYIILLGDFNINLLNTSDTKTGLFDTFLRCTGLNQVVSAPTHFSSDSQTLIDVVCTDAKTRNISVDSIGILNGHAFITCEFCFRKPRIPKKLIVFRPLKDMDMDLFIEHIDSIYWDLIAKLEDLDTLVDEYSRVVMFLFDIHAPLKNKTVKELPAPWLTSNLKFMMGLRDAALQRFRRTKLDSHKIYYKDLKKIVEVAMFNEKKCYFNQHINNNIKNPKVLWKNLKSKVIPPKAFEIPSHLNDPELINEHFLNVPGNSVTSISSLSFYEFHRFRHSSFNLKPVDSKVISKILSDQKSNSPGVDGLSMDMINLLIPKTIDIITTIINKSILTSKFPSLWKTAIVRPIPKKPNISEIKDLRPISLLPCLSKLLEKVVGSQLKHYLEVNNILPERQSGFRKNRSTTTALLDVVDNILDAQDKGKGTALILLDFSRAFDTINVPLLLSKLSYYGFDSATVKWFDSYLTHRTQFVETRNVDGSTSRSSTSTLVRGLPQGSVLGPLLFMLYCADIVTKIKYCNYHIYADDIQIYLSFKHDKVQDAVQLINEDLNNICDWALRNSLVLNANKTKYMILGSKNQVKLINFDRPLIFVDGTPVEQVRESRNLGLLMDQDLRFEKHISEVARNCFYRLQVLYKLRSHLSTDLRIQLVDTLVLSKFNYVDAVYGPRILAKTSNLIQRVQNACARFCFNIPPRSHITPFLNSNRILRMQYRRQLHLATLLFGIIQKEIPEYLYSKLSWLSENSRYPTRASAYALRFPQHRTTAFRGSFKFAATKCWNDLPPPLRHVQTVNRFRTLLKQFYFDIQFSSTQQQKW